MPPRSQAALPAVRVRPAHQTGVVRRRRGRDRDHLPSRTGDLSATTLARALLWCQRRGLTGTLELAAIVHPGGGPAADAAGSPPPPLRLRLAGGQVVALQGLPAPTAAPAVPPLRAALSLLLRRRAGRFAFYGGRDRLDPAGPQLHGDEFPCAALALSLRGAYPTDLVEAELRGLRGHHVARTAAAAPLAWALSATDQTLWDALGSPTDVDTLLGGPLAPQARGLLYLMQLTGHLAVVAPGGRAAHPAAEPAGLPSGESLPTPQGPAARGAVGVLRRELRERHRRIPHDDSFAFLDLPQSAACAEAQAAHHRLQRRFDPDRLPAALRDLRPQAEQVRTRLRRALGHLGTPAARLAYLCDLDAGGGTEFEPHGLRRVPSIIPRPSLPPGPSEPVPAPPKRHP